jgi:hypothetical protein
VDGLGSTAVAHDNQIDGLIRAAEQQNIEIDKLRKAKAGLDKRRQS